MEIVSIKNFITMIWLQGPSSQEQDSTGKSSKELKDQETGRRSGRKAGMPEIINVKRIVYYI